MKKLREMLRENYLIIPQEKLKLSNFELSFLKEFFYISEDEFFDEYRETFKKFFILEKKEKFLPFSCNF